MPEKRTASFSIIVGFIVLMIIGLALLPRLSVHLHSNRYLPQLSVSYGWTNASPRLIEQEVTAPLEGMLNTIVGIQHITSSSNRGSGHITLRFDSRADMDHKRFEVASKIREAYPSFPLGVSYPSVSPYQKESEEKTLLSYTLNAPARPGLIQEYAEDQIVPGLAHIEGLYRVHVYGATPMEWELTYDQEQLWTLGLDFGQVVSALQSYFRLEVIGMAMDDASGAGMPKPVIIRTPSGEDLDWLDIPVTEVQGRILRIRDLCTVLRKEQEPTGYYRINGNNTINIRCTAEQDANSLKVAAELKDQMSRMEQDFPAGYFLLMTDDQTSYMKDELNKIYYRTLFSFTILLLFVLLISRQFRYLLIILISLIANLLSAVILYYLIGVQINLYSLAGITVSLGLIIDNTIVMLDHMRTKKNRRVFMAILAATLTTMGALSVIRFFGEEIQEWLVDFTLVLVINLFVSLMVALFLVPSLYEKIPLRTVGGRRTQKRRRQVLRFSRYYETFIRFAQKYRWAYIVAAVLLFGLPVYLLPTRIEGDAWYHKLYEKTLASGFYVQKMKPVVDKTLGGTLRLFTTQVVNRYKYRYPERTQIYVSASLPEGAVLQQMNDLFIEVERYVGQYEQIDQYVTTISGARSGRMTITFKPEFELGAFPYILYYQLNDLANKEGGADWSIQGVGQYFNNSVSETTGSQRIILHGYHFEELIEHAEWTLSEALRHQRVQKGSIVSFITYRRDPLYEYVLRMDPERMQTYQMNSYEIMRQLRASSISHYPSGHVFIDGELEPIRMNSRQSAEFDVWMMSHSPIQKGRSVVKLEDLGRVRRESQSRTIQKENQQYVLIVEYEYIGASKLAKMHQDQLIAKVKDHLPIGFSASAYQYYWQREKPKSQFLMILLVMAIIYLICSILLESLSQPLAVVLIIPVSFVGVFLTFYLSDFSFDQGGFASFLLLSGIVVNASLYILNDFNNLQKARRYKNDEVRMYLKAYHGKIIPIFLTVMSTVLGLVPFLSGGDDSTFWFSLAVGTMGGLSFSVLALIVFLPAFMKLKTRKLDK